ERVALIEFLAFVDVAFRPRCAGRVPDLVGWDMIKRQRCRQRRPCLPHFSGRRVAEGADGLAPNVVRTDLVDAGALPGGGGAQPDRVDADFATPVAQWSTATEMDHQTITAEDSSRLQGGEQAPELLQIDINHGDGGGEGGVVEKRHGRGSEFLVLVPLVLPGLAPAGRDASDATGVPVELATRAAP